MADHLVNGSAPIENGILDGKAYISGEARDTDVVEPVAIVGLSFEFPQEATSMDAFWELLMNKRNTATAFPKERLNSSAMYHPDQNRKGQISVHGGHFLQEDIAAFDAPFFSISSSDASIMDPQQRKLLECTYKALENAGMPLEQCTGSKTSVYIGAFTNDWQHLSFKDSEEIGTTAALGVQPCLNANRISWFYNFKGNSANIDTACSSSLVALDLGCKGLRNGETNMSIVGGSNLIFSPDYLHSLSAMNMLSADGQCYSFDHRGTGYGRGEGIGILVVKRLSDALRDNDTIRAVIRNTGCNQDGNTPGITKPNPTSQEALIKETYSSAGLSMLPTRYFEAHGTGTPVGDPIESNALGSAFSKSRASDDPLWVGAVKSNIGHLEGCSGIAAVIKTVLVLEKGVIPPNTNFERINPKIDAEYLKIKLPLEPTAWPSEGLRRASVNSFGYAGTNAHTILDDALHYLEEHNLAGHHVTTREPTLSINQSPPQASSMALPNGHRLEKPATIPRVLLFSAQDESSVKRQVSQYKSHFAQKNAPHIQNEAYLDNLVYNLDRKRTSMAWRSFAIVESLNDLQKLDDIASPAQITLPKPALGFVFTGQGAQWPSMGRELTAFPAFAKSLRHAELYLKELGCSWLLCRELFEQDEHSNINAPEYSQPICTAVQVALIDLLSDFGIQPAAIVGHSSGEIAAAYSLGAISAEAALKIAYFRGVVSARLTKDDSKRGAMLSVGLSRTDVQPHIDDVASRYDSCDLTIACINSGKSVTVSGGTAQINALQALMDDKKIFARQLQVDVAYHSSHMQQVADEYYSMIGNIEKGKTTNFKVMASSVIGDRIVAEDLQSPDYWVANMVSPVKFSDAVSHLIGKTKQKIRKKLDLSHRQQLNLNMLVEVGPHAALQGPVRDILADLRRSSDIKYTSVLKRKTSALKSTLDAVGEMKCIGYPIDLVNICVPEGKRHDDLMVLPNLPEYPFDHSKTYWYESRISNRFRTQPQGKLDLLGKPVPDWNPLGPRWRNHLRVSEMPWMEDHVINGATVYPGAGMLVVAIEAAHQIADQSRAILSFELKDVQFLEPLNIPKDSTGLETQFSIHLSTETTDPVSKWSAFRLCAYEKEKWHESCRGFVRVQYALDDGEIDRGREASEELKAVGEIEANMIRTCQEHVDDDLFYQALHKSGYDIGPSFQRIYNAAVCNDYQAKGDVRIFEWPEPEYPQPHIIHPTTLDAILQMSVTVLTHGGRKVVQTVVPSSVKYMKINRQGLSYPDTSSVKCCAKLVSRDNRGMEFDYTVLNEDKSKVLAQVKGMGLTIIAGNETSDTDDAGHERLESYQIEYKPDPDLSSNSKSASLEDYLGILTHKNPGLKILEIGTGTDTSEDTILRRIQWWDKMDFVPFYYHYASPHDSTLKRAREILSDHKHAGFGALDLNTNLQDQGLEPETYDVVIVSNNFLADGNDSLMATHTRNLLKPGARLLLSKEPTTDGDRQEYSTSYDRWSSGSKLPLDTLEDSLDLTVLRKRSTPIDTLNKAVENRVVIVIDSTSGVQVRLAEQISKDFLTRDMGHHIEITSLEEASAMQSKDTIVFVVILEVDRPFIYTLRETVYSVLQNFLTSASDILWIGNSKTRQPRKPEYATIDGLARVIRNERDDYRFTSIVFELQDRFTNQQLQQLSQILHKTHFSPDPDHSQYEPEYYENDGVLYVPRLIRHEKLSQELHARSLPQRSGIKSISDSPPLKLTIGSPGLLDTLHFFEDEEVFKPLTEGEVEIQTEAIGANFKDCLIALAQLSGSSLGLECAGVVTKVGSGSEFKPGDRVVMATPGCFKTFARGMSSATCKIPEAMSFVEAAAIPAQFSTAYAVIYNMARLRTGESILIHTAAGGTGQACVQIAQFLGATVFATVGSTDKKQILVEEYGIPESHIFDSRNVSFAQGVKRVTNGRGVDVVINSLVGEAMVASWECIAPYGRFVEIGKKDIVSNSNLPMSSFAKNASFMGFDVSTLHEERPLEVKKDLEALLDMFAKKQLHSQRPLHVQSISNVQEVFRSLSSGRSAGKFVLEVSPTAEVQTTLNTTAGFSLDSNATYVIAGGLGGLGRSTARWMVDRNARNLILLSRSGIRSDNVRAFVEGLRREGVRVEAPPCDITDLNVMERVLGSLVKTMPPVKGCIQASMVARDVLFQDMSFDDWSTGVGCKTFGSWNLHAVLPIDIDFFILTSSASGLVGLRGQANYNAGNTYKDAFARWRVTATGKKTISLNLGVMVDDGILAENPDALQRVLTYGVLQPVTRPKFFGILDYYCDPKLPTPTAHESQMAVGVGTGAKSGGLDGINLSRHPLFCHLVHESQTTAASSSSSGKHEEDDGYFRFLFSDSTSLPEAANVVVRALVKKLAKTLPTLPQRVEDVDTNRPIQSYSVDSLLAVELRNWIKKELRAEVAVFETQGASTFGTLGRVVAERSALEHGGWSL